MEKRSTPGDVALSTEPARTDLTSRECAKLICGLLNGLGAILHTEDMQVLRNAFVEWVGGEKCMDSSWGTSVSVRVALRSVGSLIGALKLLTMDDSSQLDIAIQWVAESDDLWKKLRRS